MASNQRYSLINAPRKLHMAERGFRFHVAPITQFPPQADENFPRKVRSMSQFNAEVFDQGMLNMRCSIQKHTVVSSYQPSNVFNLSDSSDEEESDSKDLHKFSFSLSKLLHLRRGSSSRRGSQATTPNDSRRNSKASTGDSSPSMESVTEAKVKLSPMKEEELLVTPKTDGKSAGRSSNTKLRNSSSTESLSERIGFKSLNRKSGSNELGGSSNKFKDLLMPPTMQRRGSVSSQDSDRSSISRTSSEVSLEEKYGCNECVLGKGSFATVKLYCQGDSKTGFRYAVKEFRKRRKEEPMKDYIKKLNAEFCIASSLDHENVVKSVDLIQDNHKAWCVVMEYCPGGDLYHRINSGTLIDQGEKNCYFAQLLKGAQYLHSVGVAHRDLKPENLLIDASGRILKITDFGVSTVFRSPWGHIREKRTGVTGSGPYIAPEEFLKEEYDSELVDVWSCGIIAYVINTCSIPWRSAQVNDARYTMYLDSTKKFGPFERIEPKMRELIYASLASNPASRITMTELLKHATVESMDVCTTSHIANDHTHPCTRSSKSK